MTFANSAHTVRNNASLRAKNRKNKRKYVRNGVSKIALLLFVIAKKTTNRTLKMHSKYVQINANTKIVFSLQMPATRSQYIVYWVVLNMLKALVRCFEGSFCHKDLSKNGYFSRTLWYTKIKQTFNWTTRTISNNIIHQANYRVHLAVYLTLNALPLCCVRYVKRRGRVHNLQIKCQVDCDNFRSSFFR